MALDSADRIAFNIPATRSHDLAQSRNSAESRDPPLSGNAAALAVKGRDTPLQLSASAPSLAPRYDLRLSEGDDHRDSQIRTRIPRPKRGGVSLEEAWRLAGQEEVERARQSQSDSPDASPSPAPRTREFNYRKLSPEQGADKDRGHSRTPPADTGRKEPYKGLESAASKRISVFTTSKIGPKIAETGESLVRRTAGDANAPERSRGKLELQPNPEWLKRLDSAPSSHNPDDDRLSLKYWAGLDPEEPIASVETGSTPPTSRPASANKDGQSPNKSYAWQVDEDFTAGDLVVSESPMLRLHSNQSKQIWNQTAASQNKALDDPSPERAEAKISLLPVFRGSPYRRTNTKLDEIRARELTVGRAIPVFDTPPPRPKNVKLDEIREREINGLSKREIASSRLAELREINSQARSQSPPELERRSSKEVLYQKASEEPTVAATQDPPPPLNVRDLHANTQSVERKNAIRTLSHPGPGFKDIEAPVIRRGPQDEEGHDLLKNSNSSRSAMEQASGAPKEAAAEGVNRLVAPLKAESQQPLQSNSKGNSQIPASEVRDTESSRLSVVFAGLRRPRSMESTRDKRSSMANSDSDPIERIEGEMKLFAPVDNQSEKGSIREPSPTRGDSEDDELDQPDETPRPTKRDPLSMPTPKIVGAYFDTPLSAKTRKVDRPASDDETWVQKRFSESPLRRQYRTSLEGSSDPETRNERGVAPSSSLNTVKNRRARSLSRRRNKPIINSANPPTVQGDLLELRRLHQIEDSTVDDLEAFVSKSHLANPSKAPPNYLKPLPLEPSSAKEAVKRERDAEDELTTDQEIGKIGESLPGVLSSIRDVKLGIERLRGDVLDSKPQGVGSSDPWHPDSKPSATHDAEPYPDPKPSVAPPASPPPLLLHSPSRTSAVPALMYISLPIPRLYTREPNFRFTVLGLLLTLLSAWYASESVFCAAYCRPSTCMPSKPCEWSFNDPVWGVALPIKLDEWILGGKGQTAMQQIAEDAQDVVADVWDALTGQDISQIDQESLGFHQRRRLLRRLRKRGVHGSWVHAESPDQKAKWDVWRATRLAREKAALRMRELEAQGFDVEDLESRGFGSDERIP